MKKIAFLVICFLPFVGFGQTLSKDFKVTASEPFQVVDAPSKEYMAVKGGFTISAKTRGEKVILQKFDAKGMKEVKRNEFEDFPKYTQCLGLIKLNERLFYVFEAYNKSEKTFSVYSRDIDVEKASFGKIETLFTTTDPVTRVLTPSPFSNIGVNFTQMPKFDIVTSFDESKVLIRYRNKPEVKNDSKSFDELGFYVFDATFKKIWGKEVKMPHTEKEMDNLAYTVGSDGTAYMLARVNETKSFEVITVTNEGIKNKKLPIKAGMMFFKFDLKESVNGNIIAAGYYANGMEVNVSWSGTMTTSVNINGIYVFEFAKDGSIKKENDYPFPIELIKTNLSERQKDKADKREAKDVAGINDLWVKNFVVNKDGSIVIVGEVQYMRNEWWMTSLENVIHFGDIVITKIDAQGKLVWAKKLAKNQAILATDRGDMPSLGIAYIQGNDSHYMLFVDNRKNADLPMDMPAAPHKGGFGGYLTAYKVDDASGKVQKHLIMDLTNIQGIKAYQFSLDRGFWYSHDYLWRQGVSDKCE